MLIAFYHWFNRRCHTVANKYAHWLYFWHTCVPKNTCIDLLIRAVRSEYSLTALWIAKDPRFLQADSEDSDQTAHSRRLIWVFAGRTCQNEKFLTLQHICFSGRINRNSFEYMLWPCIFYSMQRILQTGNECSDQTVRMHRTFWVCVLCICPDSIPAYQTVHS